MHFAVLRCQNSYRAVPVAMLRFAAPTMLPCCAVLTRVAVLFCIDLCTLPCYPPGPQHVNSLNESKWACSSSES